MSVEISVIVVAWNCRKVLSDCLESILLQVEPERSEIIVVDNASSDGTAAMVRANFPSVKLIESDVNLGFARGNNLGLEAATGEYIFLINPDVVVGSDTFAKMLDHLRSHPGIGMLGPKIIGRDGAVQRSCMRTPTLWNQLCRALALDTLNKKSRLFGGYLMNEFPHDALRDVDIINGCFWLVRRTALEQVGEMDPQFWMYADDLDWCRRYTEAGWRVVFFPHADAIHLGAVSSDTAPVFCYVQMQQADLQYWRKYHGVFSSACFFFTLYLSHALRSAVSALLYVVHASGRSRVALKCRKHFACIRWLTLQIISPRPGL
ncbi:MAG: glycosyltransferase family 2 protein [Terriglobales bacterium]